MPRTCTFSPSNSFQARGQTDICSIPDARRTIFEEDRREDVFAAIRWLSQRPDVDAGRIAVLGWSHGAQTVLSVLDRTDKFVQAQPIQPRAAVAYYAGCGRFSRMWNYEISAPLLLMSGELDNWTPARDCTILYERISTWQKDASIKYQIFPDSYHGFNGTGPVRTVDKAANTKTGTATAGGNPEAREASYRMMFEFLSVQFNLPLLLSNEQRLQLVGHRYVMPADSGFARIDDSAAVPVKPEGKARYVHYLSLEKPKAFVVTETGGWFFNDKNTSAMSHVFSSCARAKVKCWLYAVNDTVVWSRAPEARITLDRLQAR
ncbi:MAG: prolyl oligopeptidase family serine peptidase [Rhodocyclaceae bacterium]